MGMLEQYNRYIADVAEPIDAEAQLRGLGAALDAAGRRLEPDSFFHPD